MSSDAGKVYFVLYLAVVLELLIIIVERDEAEEHLLRKQKESMKIVESILSQLQSGSGTEGINTRPQDEITLPPPGVNIKEVMGADLKSWRKYIVEVGVTDISNDLKRHEGEVEKEYNERLKKLVELASVEEIEYQIFFSSSEDPNNAPMFPSDAQIKKQYNSFVDFQPGQTIDVGDGSFWEFLSVRRLKLDKDATYNNLDLNNLTPESVRPIYPKEKIFFNGPSFVPKDVQEDSVFFYSEVESLKDAKKGSATNEFKKRAFVINFQPPDKQGWYKLRFSSRTNRILGVRGGTKLSQIDKDTKVNIGTVQLSVEALEKVKKELSSKLEKYSLPPAELLIEQQNLELFDQKLKAAKEEANKDENATEVRGKIDLFGYIVKLLAPGQSINFEQNRGAIEFNVRVITPKPPIAEPVISYPTYTANFDKIPAVFEFTISPWQGKGANFVEGKVMDMEGKTVARLSCQPLDQIAGSSVTPPTTGGKQEWRATVDQNLDPGKYKIELTHKLHAKSKVETADLEIFKTGLANADELDRNLSFLTVYGGRLNINAQPTSGGKIKSNQFRIYLSTDVDDQRPPFEGLSMEEVLEVGARANNVTLEVTWIQPYTNKEIELFPKKNYQIKQKQPTINARKQRATPDSEDGKKIKVIVQELEIFYPPIGSAAESGSKKAELKISAKNGTVNLKGGSYEFSSEPQVEQEVEENSIKVRITAELSGSLDRGQERIDGTISLELTATAINPFNGKVSDPKKEPITIPIKISIDKRGGGRRPGGGGGPPPGGGGPPKR
ncbi:MAG: hypothetical protein V1779_04215 [bacterium]